MLKLTENTRFYKYLQLKMIAEFNEQPIVDMPIRLKFRRKNLPASIWDIKFSQFIQALNCLDSIPEYLQQITNVNKNNWNRSKIKVVLPLYSFYRDDMLKILNVFKQATDQAPKAPVTVKDMQEFGLTTIVDMVADSKLIDYGKIYNMSVAEVQNKYRMMIWNSMNLDAQQKYYAKNS